jgi:hypothetical protein
MINNIIANNAVTACDDDTDDEELFGGWRTTTTTKRCYYSRLCKPGHVIDGASSNLSHFFHVLVSLQTQTDY